MAKARQTSTLTISSLPPPPPPSPSDHDLVRSLLRLSRDLSVLDDIPPPFLRSSFAAVSRRANILTTVFDEILQQRDFTFGNVLLLPRAASLCMREIQLVLQRFKSLLADCSAPSSMRLLLQSDAIAAELHELHLDLATLLELLPVAELRLSDDVIDLVVLTSRQCRKSAPAFALKSAQALKSDVLGLIQEVEQEIVPERSRLESILDQIGIKEASICRDEIECLEREIGDHVAEKWTPAMIALIGLLRYAKCVLFGASTPRPEASAADSSTGDEPPAPPTDFRCPITLELMTDPVVVSSGQTYDRDSITRWFGSGKTTCPKTGQVLTNLEMVPNKALKNLISKWCRENGVQFEGSEPGHGDPAPSTVVPSNKAALEAARMTASFLVEELAGSPAPDAANRVVHEIRLLCKSGSDSRAFVAEAGAVPLLVPLLYSDDSSLQHNAITALLNLSILEANKKRIMHADGAVEAVANVMGAAGATWRAKENAAAAVLSICSVHSYRRRLGRNRRLLETLVELVRTGPASTKKDALAAILGLTGERETIPRLVECGVVEAAVATLSEEETAAAVLAAIAKRGGADAVANAEGAVVKLVNEMRRGTERGRESAAAALVLVCRRIGASAVTRVMSVPGIEWAIWELIGTGTERARRKAASLGRICRRWAAAALSGEADRAVSCPAVNDNVAA